MKMLTSFATEDLRTTFEKHRTILKIKKEEILDTIRNITHSTYPG